MNIFNYIIGSLKNLFNLRISKFALVDTKSYFDPTARLCYLAKSIDSKVNSYSYIGPRTILIYVEVGKFCSIASDCLIGLATHPLKNISTSPIFVSKTNATKYKWSTEDVFNEVNKVNIGNDVWIGTKVIILGGIKIGNGAVIGAGSIVTKDIPDYAVAVGIPAQVIKYRFTENIITKLIEIKWWDFPENKLRNQLSTFQKQSFSLDDLIKLEKFN